MIVSSHFAVVRVLLGLLVLVLVLAGCGAEGVPEEPVEPSPTVVSKMVPVKTSTPKATASPTPALRPTSTFSPEPSPTTADAPTKEKPGYVLSTGPMPGYMAPDFSLDDPTGQRVALSGFRGQPVVMIFWTSWCPYCQDEMPLLQRMYEQYGDEGLVVVGVDVLGSGGETRAKGLAWVEEHDITFPIVFDEEALVFREYRGRGIPMLVFVNRAGMIETLYPGAMDEQNLEKQIQELVEGS